MFFFVVVFSIVGYMIWKSVYLGFWNIFNLISRCCIDPEMFYFILFFLFILRESACTWVGKGQRERESQAGSTLCWNPMQGLNPWTVRPWPELTLHRLSHPGAPDPYLKSSLKAWEVGVVYLLWEANQPRQWPCETYPPLPSETGGALTPNSIQVWFHRLILTITHPGWLHTMVTFRLRLRPGTSLCFASKAVY